MRLLLVEDDPILGNGIEVGLKQAGFAVDWVRDGHAAQLALQTTEYELVLLDLGLPRVSGMDVLRQLRGKGSDVPVLLLTARDTVHDRVTGFWVNWCVSAQCGMPMKRRAEASKYR